MPITDITLAKRRKRRRRRRRDAFTIESESRPGLQPSSRTTNSIPTTTTTEKSASDDEYKEYVGDNFNFYTGEQQSQDYNNFDNFNFYTDTAYDEVAGGVNGGA